MQPVMIRSLQTPLYCTAFEKTYYVSNRYPPGHGFLAVGPPGCYDGDLKRVIYTDWRLQLI